MDSTKNEALGDTDDVDITLGTPYVRCAKSETTCDSHAPQAIAIFPVLQFHTTNNPGVTTLRPCRPDSGLWIARIRRSCNRLVVQLEETRWIK